MKTIYSHYKPHIHFSHGRRTEAGNLNEYNYGYGIGTHLQQNKPYDPPPVYTKDVLTGIHDAGVRYGANNSYWGQAIFDAGMSALVGGACTAVNALYAGHPIPNIAQIVHAAGVAGADAIVPGVGVIPAAVIGASTEAGAVLGAETIGLGAAELGAAAAGAACFPFMAPIGLGIAGVGMLSYGAYKFTHPGFLLG